MKKKICIKIIWKETLNNARLGLNISNKAVFIQSDSKIKEKYCVRTYKIKS